MVMRQHKYGEAQGFERSAFGFSGHEFFVFMKNLRKFAPIGEALIVRTNDPGYHFVPRRSDRLKALEKIDQILDADHVSDHSPTTLDILREDRLQVAKDIKDPKIDLTRSKGEVILGHITTAYVFNMQRNHIASSSFEEPDLVQPLLDKFYDESVMRIAQTHMIS